MLQWQHHGRLGTLRLSFEGTQRPRQGSASLAGLAGPGSFGRGRLDCTIIAGLGGRGRSRHMRTLPAMPPTFLGISRGAAFIAVVAMRGMLEMFGGPAGARCPVVGGVIGLT